MANARLIAAAPDLLGEDDGERTCLTCRWLKRFEAGHGQCHSYRSPVIGIAERILDAGFGCTEHEMEPTEESDG